VEARIEVAQPERKIQRVYVFEVGREKRKVGRKKEQTERQRPDAMRPHVILSAVF
jgi:predicted NAD-dependent protein-ADP-ribosyltransferase YbiA (DUF1768 family)